MLNHSRTLLLNVDGSPSGYTAGPGEEFIPPEFKAFRLTGALREIHAILFGADPDRTARNYLVRQYLGLLHATELSEYVLAFDQRITYDPLPVDDFYTDQFVPRVIKLDDTSTELFLVGRVAPVDRSGRTQHACRVEVLTESTVRVQRLTPPLSDALQSYTLDSGLSSLIELPGTGLQAMFHPGDAPEDPAVAKLSLLNYATPWFTVLPAPNDPLTVEDKKHLLHLIGKSIPAEASVAGPAAGRWQVQVASRPEKNLALVATELKNAEQLLNTLFGESSPRGRNEPFKTFRSVWRHHPEMPYRLGAVLLAWLFRADEFRKGEL